MTEHEEEPQTTSHEAFDRAINASGYPFEMAVEETLRGLDPVGVEFIAGQFPWYDERKQQDRFLDMVASKGNFLRFAIECKRHACEWLFLRDSRRPVTTPQSTILTNVLMRDYPPDAREQIVRPIALPPESAVSSNCVIRDGRSSRDSGRETLEAICGELVRATDALASATLRSETPHKLMARTLINHIPVLITSAHLYVSSFDPASVDLSSGTVAGIEHEAVPWVRFEKAFTAATTAEVGYGMGSLVRPRTVFVVNSTAVSEFLKAIGD